MLILIIFAFLSGIVTILSPCILPVLPIILSGSLGDKKKPIGIIVGFISSFVFFSLTLTWIVKIFNLPSEILRYTAVVFITISGVVMLTPKLKEKLELLLSVLNRGSNKKRTGFIGGIFVGISLGIIWTPCVGPIMASVIALAATQTINLISIFIIIAYSVGTSIPMFAVIIGGKKILSRIPFLTKNPVRIQKFFGLIMIIVGLSLGFNFDRRFQSVVLSAFPRYGTGLTVFENRDSVKNAIEKYNKIDSGSIESTLIGAKEPKNGNLGNYGLAPEFIDNQQNISINNLKGRVILVDFWTYSCVNCVRTIPYLRSWYERYKEYGLEIIGIHTPEFAFERSIKNVERAISDLGVTWPVIQDNDYLQWKSYGNRYWPAKYFIDSNGYIRYFHFGEGDYKESENVIRKLLEENGATLPSRINKDLKYEINSKTPEMYLGYGRTRGFKSPQGVVPRRVVNYEDSSDLKNGEWSLLGNWTINEFYIEPLDKGELNFNFYAKNVFIVIESDENQQGVIEVYLDGIKTGEFKPRESKLYELVNIEKAGNHNLNLKVEGSFRLFALTFG